MKAKHFFFTGSPELVTQRWREAFTGGRVCEPRDINVRLRRLAPTKCLIWLSSSDAKWAGHLTKVFQILPGARVILLSSSPTQLEGLGAFDVGVRGYAHAYGVPAMLQEVATVVEHGGLWVGPDLLRRLVGSTTSALASHPRPEVIAASPEESGTTRSAAVLSGREDQVARAVSAGRSNKEVADLMFISERTVKAHLSSVFEKLGVRDRLQLALRMAATKQESAP